MGLLSRARALFLGRRRTALSAARRAEALGQLAEATALYLEADAPDEAVRLFELRADAALSASERHLLLGQALVHATGVRAREVERRRARLELELARSGQMQKTKEELRALAGRLAALAEPTAAAEVYALLGDAEGQAKMLVEAGAIEQLESVLDADRERLREEREAIERAAQLRDLVASGRRREALELSSEVGDDPGIRDLMRRVRDTRVTGARVRLELDGEGLSVVFGDPVTLGRAGALITVASPAVSREHLAIFRTPAGPRVEDLGSSNGTLLRGIRLDAPLAIEDRVELMLGGEVPLVLEPWGDGGLSVECAGERSHVPLGPFVGDGFRLAPAPDGWLELEALGPLRLGSLRVGGSVQLCRGDEIRSQGGGPVRLRIP